MPTMINRKASYVDKKKRNCIEGVFVVSCQLFSFCYMIIRNPIPKNTVFDHVCQPFWRQPTEGGKEGGRAFDIFTHFGLNIIWVCDKKIIMAATERVE